MIKHEYNGATTVAKIDGASLDAVRVLAKRTTPIRAYVMKLGDGDFDEGLSVMMSCKENDIFCLRKANMLDTYTASVTCHADDEYDKETGRNLADEKLIAKHKRAKEKAILAWVNWNIRCLEVNTLNIFAEPAFVGEYNAKKLHDSAVLACSIMKMVEFTRN